MPVLRDPNAPQSREPRRIVGRTTATVHHLRASRPCATDEAPLVGGSRSMDERAAAVFVDMDAHDFVERALGLEAQLTRAARLDTLRPARDDARDQRILSATNARGHALAGDAAQRRDLLGDSA